MLNGKGRIIHLTAELIKKDCIKWVNTFLNHMNFLEETLMLKLIYLNTQQKQILKKLTEIDTSNLALTSNLAK